MALVIFRFNTSSHKVCVHDSLVQRFENISEHDPNLSLLLRCSLKRSLMDCIQHKYLSLALLLRKCFRSVNSSEMYKILALLVLELKLYHFNSISNINYLCQRLNLTFCCSCVAYTACMLLHGLFQSIQNIVVIFTVHFFRLCHIASN